MVLETSHKTLGNQKIAIFGGTFDPTHWGHLSIAQTALQQAVLDLVIWVPSYRPPHRSSSQLSAFQHRLEMVKRAIVGYPQFTVSSIEANRSDRSFAIQTLTDLKAHYSQQTEWYWIIGLDAFQTLPKWYQSEALMEQCQWLVAPRVIDRQPRVTIQPESRCQQGCDDSPARSPSNLCWQLLQMPTLEVSSSEIRQRLQIQQPIQHLVPKAVSRYILTQNLYGTVPATT